jgi:2,5-diamino-6-(ribosylamino)-4(3H)-pyrimidinone 5'-phosphate reductase
VEARPSPETLFPEEVRIVTLPKVVTLNIASLDGRVAVSRDVLLLWGDDRWQALGDSGGTLEWLTRTHQPQATLEGSGSFVRDTDEPDALPAFAGDPQLLCEDFVPEAVAERPGHRGWFVVVDGRGRGRGWVKDGAAFGPAWEGWHLLVLTGHHTPPAYLASLRREMIPYLVAGQGPVDLRLALEKLGDRLGVTRLLSTGGGRLNGALLRAGLVDEVNVEFLPGIVGGLDTPALFDSPALGPGELPIRLNLISAQIQTDGRVWVRYGVD